jgi:allantoate deiminase
VHDAARDVIGWCRTLAGYTEQPGVITRRCLSAPMREVHRDLTAWMRRLGLEVRVDAAGNLRGLRRSGRPNAPRLYLGSHLDTVPDAGAFDGVLGVVWAIAVLEALGSLPLPFDVEVLGFSDEEGTRFGVPFIGSRALAGTVDDTLLRAQDPAGTTLAEAIRACGLDPAQLDAARAVPEAVGYLECHIEQGPVLEHLNVSLGLVDVIVGQTRADARFVGHADHAGTTPMHLRRDAVAGAAEWIARVEQTATATPGLVATTGRIEAQPGAVNVIAGACTVSLDLRHADDGLRRSAGVRLRAAAEEVAARRQLTIEWQPRMDQAAVAMDPSFSAELEQAASDGEVPIHRMPSGAGHDAMIMATLMPTALLFVRSPRGISHHPDETVRVEDVAAALAVGRRCLLGLGRASHG